MKHTFSELCAKSHCYTLANTKTYCPDSKFKFLANYCSWDVGHVKATVHNNKNIIFFHV